MNFQGGHSPLYYELQTAAYVCASTDPSSHLLTWSEVLGYLHCYSAWQALQTGEGLINVGFYIDKCGCAVLLTHGNVGGCLERNQLLCNSSVPVPTFECLYKTQLLQSML